MNTTTQFAPQWLKNMILELAFIEEGTLLKTKQHRLWRGKGCFLLKVVPHQKENILRAR